VQATLKLRNLTGQRYIAMDPGPGAPGAYLAPGATIPLSQTHPAINLTQLFTGFRPLLQALSPNDVNTLSMELVQVLQGEGTTVSSLLAHTASLTSTLANKDQVIGSVIDNLNQVLDTVNARDTQLTGLIITVRQLVSGLASDRNTIGEAISSIGDLTDTTAHLLDDARPPLRDDIHHLGELADHLNDRRDLVKHFITFLPTKLNRLTPLGSFASWFNFFFCTAEVKATPDGPLIPVPVPGGPDPRCTSGNDASFSFEGQGSGDHAFRSGGSGDSSAASVAGLIDTLPLLLGGGH
jgi:phospholipid/cholesterol/gamma-HCH transport system substrate-binding protein